MSQFRKDPFSSAWVMISPERGLESSEFGMVEPMTGPSPLAWASQLLADELAVVHDNSFGVTSEHDNPNWQIRVIRHPDAVLSEKELLLQPSKLFQSASNSGYQELIIEHPRSDMALENMPKSHLINVLKMYRERLKYLAQKDYVKHVHLSRSVGKAAGDIYGHPHAQVVALPFENRWLEEEKKAGREYYHYEGHCLYCDVMAEEIRLRERLISSNEHFIALSPYAAKLPFETWILPRQHSSAFSSVVDSHMQGLATILADVLQALNQMLNRPPYHMLLHTLPSAEDGSYHWHLEILPKLTAEAGFDMGSGLYINPTPPEEAARFLRQTLAMQEVRF